ncbi:unnamed protein product [Notodromas monacha]|uniref:B9 domain-containing protein 2 n=1 Tax=Notodromas monacha TaxID=399045 RepID=A0A7R9GC53_9CRUS|nr:unnamed protein product [Notodromas monacha]CAG0917254.1 unnamed protein product [Notodromas monacha]
MAELHLIGQLVGAIDFSSGSCLFCKWSVSAGGSWRLLGGAESGQTQTAAGTMVTGSESGQWFWSHPIDVHYATKGVQGWPKLMCQVFHLDLHGRCVLEGYGVTHFPASPGLHQDLTLEEVLGPDLAAHPEASTITFRKLESSIDDLTLDLSPMDLKAFLLKLPP